MNRANYFNGQRVTADDLNYTETSKSLATQRYLKSLAARFIHQVDSTIPPLLQQTNAEAGGPFATVANGVLGGINSTYLSPVTGSVTQISVSQGWAITEGMDLIQIASTVTVNQGDDTFNTRWVDISNGTMWVVAEYQEVSGSVAADVNGNSVYTRYTPSCRINVTATAPTASNQVALAQFTGNSGAVTSNTFQDIRPFFRPWAAAESTLIETPAVSGITNMEQHQAAVGHATPTNFNPHGIAIGDLGGIPLFVNGIYVMDTIPATFQSYQGTVGPVTQINFTVPSHATGSVANSSYTNALPPLSTITPTVLPDDVYYVVAAPTGSILMPQFVPISSIVNDPLQPQLNPSLLFIGEASVVSSNIVAYQDIRTFYNQSQALIRADIVEGFSDPAIALTPYNTLVDTLNRIRFQVGVALNNTGSAWLGPNPLTAGPTSDAQTYHTHGDITDLIKNRFGPSITGKTFSNVYLNGSDRTIAVAISFVCGIATGVGSYVANLNVGITSGSITTTIASAGGAFAGTNVGNNCFMMGFIPPGYYYTVEPAATGSPSLAVLAAITAWVEYTT